MKSGVSEKHTVDSTNIDRGIELAPVMLHACSD